MYRFKRKYIYLSIVIFFLILSLGFFDIISGGKINLAKFLPDKFKVFLKETIYIIPILKREIKIKNERYDLEKIKSLSLWKNNSLNNGKIFDAKIIYEDNIIINNQKLILHKLLLPVPDYFSWGQKSVGYIDQYLDNYIFISGDGVIYYFKDEALTDSNLTLHNSIKLFKVDSNLSDFISASIKSSGKNSFKDILINTEEIYVSYVNEKLENCLNVEVLRGTLNFKQIYFNNFFSYEECLPDINSHALGGNLSKYKNNEILLTLGDGLTKNKAQNPESFFGKVIAIDKIKNYRKLSLGHRNPQGLYFDEENNILISTEHGPKGGDEINLIKDDGHSNNFGWPIASYGEHYPSTIEKYKSEGNLDAFLKDFPLHKSHHDYSFVEPLTYFTPSVGISEVVKISKNNKKKNLRDLFLVGTLGRFSNQGEKSIYYFRINKNYKIEKINDVFIGERIRDLIVSNNQNYIIAILENTAAIGIISLK